MLACLLLAAVVSADDPTVSLPGVSDLSKSACVVDASREDSNACRGQWVHGWRLHHSVIYIWHHSTVAAAASCQFLPYQQRDDPLAVATSASTKA